MADDRRPGRAPRRRWTLERVLFALAATMTLASVTLALLISPWFLLSAALVGVSQWAYVVLGDCPASLVLRRCGLQEASR
jgi:ABC-type transport system involved in cytochrome bd biosynthesis fused ATPase/permease subunit